MSGDELDDLFGLALSAPVGQAEPVFHRRGRILTFNKNTLQNTVLVDGQVFTDLPLLGVGDAAALVAGAEVGLWCVQNSWAIVGRWVKPNTADATNAITQVSQRIYSAQVLSGGFTTSTTFVDLSSVGPTVSDVLVGAAGRVLVFAACRMNYGATNGIAGGVMAFAYSGPSSASAQDGWGPTSHLAAQGVAVTTTVIDDKARMTEISGLTPGLYTFTAKYRATDGTNGCNFNSPRTLIVFAL